MKNKFIELILPAFTTVVITFLLQYFGELLTQPDGTFSISLLRSGNEIDALIELDNKSKKIQSNLVFLVESKRNGTIKSSNYIDYKISMSNIDSSKYLLTISNNLPKSECKIIINGLSENAKITFANSDDKKYVSKTALINRQFDAFRKAIISTLIYGLLFGLFYLYFMYQFNQSIDVRKIEIDKLIENTKNIKKEVDAIRTASIKQRLLLMAKVRDYEKEISFWKTLISRIILEDKTTNPKKLFDKVTTELKSFGTRDFNDEQLTMAEYIDKMTKEK